MKNGPYELVIAPEDYPGKRYRGKYCYEHHLIWWQHTGTLPKPGEIVHHKDEDKRHNVFDNFELLTNEEHGKLHGAEKTREYIRFKCPACDAIFVREKRNSHLSKGGRYSVCSKVCRGVMSGTNRIVEDNDPRLVGNVVESFRSVVAVAS